MGLPLPEPVPGEHQVSPEQRVGDAQPDTFGRWADPERDTMHHHYRWDKDAPVTTRRRTPQPRRPVSIRAWQLANNGETWAPPCWRGARTRGQRPGPTEGPSWDSTEAARRRHVRPYPDNRPSPWDIAQLARDDHSSLLRARSPAGIGDVSTHETSACCLMLPAHPRDYRGQYTPVPDAPRPRHRKSDRQRLCRTPVRQRDIHRLRTTVQRLAHSEANRQSQLLTHQQTASKVAD